MNNIIYTVVANVKPFCQLWSMLQRIIQIGKNYFSLLFGKLCLTVFAASGFVKASLTYCVINVFLCTSKKQVKWVTARRIVASMADIKTIVYKSVRKLKRHSVGANNSSIMVEFAVSVVPFCAHPKPAFGGLSNFNPDPKPFRKFYWIGSLLTAPRSLGNLVLHKSVVLICATSPAIHGAGTPFIMSTLTHSST